MRVLPLLPAAQSVRATTDNMSDDEYADLWQTVRAVSKVVEKFFDGNALNMAIQDGRGAGQSVPHVHVHILPRQQGDYNRMDDVHEDIEKWQMDEETPYQSRSTTGNGSTEWPEDEERMPRTAEDMQAEAATLRKAMEDAGFPS